MDTKSLPDSNTFNIENIDFWRRYKEFISNNVNKRTTLDRINYSKKYYQILRDDNAQELLSLPVGKRVHVMKALASLSKFTGCYDKWNLILKKFNLKWSDENGLDIFKSIMIDQDKSYDSMLEWIKQTVHSSFIPQQ